MISFRDNVRPNIVPFITVALVSANIGVFISELLLSPAQLHAWVGQFGMVPARLNQMLTDGSLDSGALFSLFSSLFLHGGWLHLIFNLVALIAFGSGVERLLGGARMLFTAVLGGVAGVLLHVLIYPSDTSPLIGASGGLSALFGLTMFAIAMRSGGWRRLISVTAIWLGLNLAFGLVGVPGDETVEVAWVAHMGGYFAGLAYGFWLMRNPVGGRR